MAGLTQSLIAERTIKTSGGEFTVRGVGLEAILGLFERRREDLASLFGRLVTIEAGQPKLQLGNGGMIAALLLHEAPIIAAELIAMGAGEVVEAEHVAIARALPFPVQMAALESIADLTFTSDMPPKKVVEAVVGALGGMANAALALLGSENGSGESEGNEASPSPTDTETSASGPSDGSQTKQS